VLVDQGGGTSLVPASTMKVFRVATALESYGADYRFRTPVHRVGEVVNGGLFLHSLHRILPAGGWVCTRFERRHLDGSPKPTAALHVRFDGTS
jgi:hypothetical protein